MHKTVHNLSCLCLLIVLIITPAAQNMQIEKTTFMDSVNLNDTTSMHIATVICTTNESTKTRNQAAIMIKSVIISAKLNKVPQITFIVIVENVDHADYLWKKLKEYGHPFDDLEVNLFFYEAAVLAPITYHPMAAHSKCSYFLSVPHFLAKVLTQIDSVVYLSNNTIIVGNVLKYWNVLGQMSDDQMIGISFDNEEQCPYTSCYFNDIPYLKSTRLTTGMMVMNLTRMRDYHWEEKFTRIFTDYSQLLNRTLNECQVLNIFMYYNSGLFKLLPCQYNFLSIYCTLNNLCCPEVNQDSEDIIALSGVLGSDNDFKEIYEVYESINLTDQNVDLKRDLMKLITAIYELPSKLKRTKQLSKCDGRRSKYLFASHFSQN